MANYVYNYLFCDEKAKDRMMILDGDDCSLLNGCYDIIVTPIKDSRSTYGEGALVGTRNSSDKETEQRIG